MLKVQLYFDRRKATPQITQMSYTDGMTRIVQTVLFLLFFATQSFAAVLIATPRAELMKRAHAIVRGTVTAQRSFWTVKKDAILTEVTLKVVHNYKNGAYAILTFVIPGGQIENRGMAVAGTPSFSRGEDVLVLLREERNQLSLSALGLSAFRIVAQSHGSPRVEQQSQDISLLGKSGAISVRSYEPPPTLLTDLEREIAAALGASH